MYNIFLLVGEENRLMWYRRAVLAKLIGYGSLLIYLLADIKHNGF